MTCFVFPYTFIYIFYLRNKKSVFQIVRLKNTVLTHVTFVILYYQTVPFIFVTLSTMFRFCPFQFWRQRAGRRWNRVTLYLHKKKHICHHLKVRNVPLKLNLHPTSKPKNFQELQPICKSVVIFGNSLVKIVYF